MSKPKIFISYSSKDRIQVEAIHKSLEVAGFDVWRDQTRLDTNWSREIAYALAESNLLCLLWSDNSATSKWVTHEWLTARALEKKIIPCLFPNAPDLPEPLHNLHGVSFASIDEGCIALCKRISEAEGFYEKYDYTILPRNSYIPFNPNPHFTGRDTDLLELYLKMIGNLNKIGINQVGLVGMGGIGKTQLAVEFAFRFSYWFHAVYWVQAANYDTWITEFVSIAKDRLRREIKDFDKLEGDRQYLFALQDYFKDHTNTLVIMDNVTEPKFLNNDSYLFGLTPLTLGCDLLFTTRRHFQLPGISSQAVDVLDPDNAYRLLTSHRTPETVVEENDARFICNALGYLPLAIVLAGARLKYLKEHKPETGYEAYCEELRERKLDTVDWDKMTPEDLATRHEAAVEATLQGQWKLLKDKSVCHLFTLAGQFPEASIIPKARLGLLSGIGPGKSKLADPLTDALASLYELSLAEQIHLEGGMSALRLHPLVHEFSNKLVPEKEQAQFRATAARKLWDAFFEYSRFKTEVQNRGPEAVITDIESGLDWLGNDGERFKELKLLHGALRLSSHVLLQDPSQLATQLLGRLLEEEYQDIIALLEEARKSKRSLWLRPLHASLTQPGGQLIRTLVGHTDDVQTVAVLPNGIRAVSGSRDKTLKVWDLETGKEIMNLKGHTGWVNAVAVAPDGRHAVSGSDDNTLKVWDLETGREIRSLVGHTGFVNAVAVMPDGKRAVSGSHDNTLKVWNLETGKETMSLDGHTAWVNAVAVTPDDRRLVSGSWDKTLKVWDLETGKEIRSFEDHSLFETVTVTADSSRVISDSYDGTLKVWDLETGREIWTLEGHTHGVHAVAVTPDNRRAVSGSYDNTLKVWNLETGKEIMNLDGHTGTVNTVAVTPDGRHAVSGSEDNTLKVWDLEADKGISSVKRHAYKVSAVAVTTDGRYAVSASWDTTLKVWDLETGTETMSLDGHTAWVNAVAVTPDGKRLVSGAGDNTLKAWELETGKEIWSIDRFNGNFVTELVVMPDGRRLVAGSSDRTLKVLDLETGKEIRSIEGHTDVVYAMAVMPDGKHLVTGSGDFTLKVWNLETGKETMNLEGHKALVNSVAVTPDGKRLVSGSGDNTLKLWDLETEKEIRSLESLTGFGDVVVLMPDGKLAISGSSDNQVILWNLESGEPLASFWGDSSITACAVSPDGKTIVAGEQSGRVHFLRVESDVK